MEKIKVPTDKTCSACKGQIIEEFIIEYKEIDSSRMIVGGPPQRRGFDLVSKFYCEDCGMNFNPTENNGLKSFPHKENIINVLQSLNNPKTLLRDLSNSEVSFNDNNFKKTFLKGDEVFVYKEETMSESLTRNSGRFHLSSASEVAELEEKQNGRFLIPGEKSAKRFDLIDEWNKEFSKIQKEAYDKAMAMIKSGKTFKSAKKYYESKIKDSKLFEERIGVRTSLKKDNRIVTYPHSVPFKPSIPKPKPPVGSIPAIIVIFLDQEFNQHYCWIPKDAI